MKHPPKKKYIRVCISCPRLALRKGALGNAIECQPSYGIEQSGWMVSLSLVNEIHSIEQLFPPVEFCIFQNYDPVTILLCSLSLMLKTRGRQNLARRHHDALQKPVSRGGLIFDQFMGACVAQGNSSSLSSP